MAMKHMMLLTAVLLVVAYANGQTTPVPILKQINRVNDDGSYTYGFEAADGTFKVESRDSLGNVRGKYGYVDETGVLKTIEYAAGQGFEASGAHIPVADVPAAAPLPVSQPVAAHPRRPVPRPIPVVTTSRPVMREQPVPVPARHLPTPSLSVPSFTNVRQQQAVPQHSNTVKHNGQRGFSFSIEAPVFHPTTSTAQPFVNQRF